MSSVHSLDDGNPCLLLDGGVVGIVAAFGFAALSLYDRLDLAPELNKRREREREREVVFFSLTERQKGERRASRSTAD